MNNEELSWMVPVINVINLINHWESLGSIKGRHNVVGISSCMVAWPMVSNVLIRRPVKVQIGIICAINGCLWKLCSSDFVTALNLAKEINDSKRGDSMVKSNDVKNII